MQDSDSAGDDGLDPDATVTRGGRVRTPMRATPPPAGAKPAMAMPGGSIADRRAGYEARAAATNPSLTPLRMSPPPAGYSGGPAAPVAPANPDEEVSPGQQPLPTGDPAANSSTDLLAYGKANNVARPAAAPQSEANNPMSGGLQTAPPGSSVPAAVPAPSGHFGGTGPLRRSFSNPTSAAMYHEMVKPMANRLFGKTGQSKARTGLRPSPAAVA